MVADPRRRRRLRPLSTELRVRVKPRASANRIEGYRDGILQVRLTAPPADGAANAALIKLLAKAAGVPRNAVTIARGERSREKLVRFKGVAASQLPW